MSTAERFYRVGWVVDSAPSRVFSFPWQKLGPVSMIRYGNVARYLDRHEPRLRMERFLPWRRYDAVVFLKKLNPAVLKLAREFKGKSTRVIFDSNVNYYEDWGEFQIPGTRPTAEQMTMAFEMTTLADLVVADSSYLSDLCRKINPATVMIPDAVDADLYKPANPKKRTNSQLQLIWSGISKKAHHLQLIEKVLIGLKDLVALHLVINRPHPKDPPSPVIDRLQKSIGARVTYYDYRGYIRDLQNADVIISPKILSSSYEMAHTEYKITTGMAVGRPALASPQGSYVEAIDGDRGGWICRTAEEWENRLRSLSGNRRSVQEMGDIARRRVLERYSVAAVAEIYKTALLECLKMHSS